MNDVEAIRSVLDGNTGDFSILVDRYQQIVFRVAMGFFHDREEAEDLTQEIFVKVWNSLGKFRGDSLFSTWLHRIAVNACLNHTRKNKTMDTRLESLSGTEGAFATYLMGEDDPEDIIIKKENSQWLQNALDSLPENQQTAIVLSKYDDLPQREIAEIMNISEGAVEALLHRAKKNLREKLASAEKNEFMRRKN
jgi:RNA polymerase sigma-70 factor, ECF subfamily